MLVRYFCPESVYYDLIDSHILTFELVSDSPLGVLGIELSASIHARYLSTGAQKYSHLLFKYISMRYKMEKKVCIKK